VTSSAPGTPSSVPIPGTERHELPSKRTGRVYDISIGLPEGYDDRDGLYPVIYVLDGQWDFKLMLSVYGALCFDMFVPSAIVVGIAAGGDSPDHEALRVRDYTPTVPEGFEAAGEADGFLAFLSEELLPFVEGHHRASPTDRTLVGASLGGLFALHALFTEPERFGRLVIVNPAIFWDEEAVAAQEEQLARHRTDLPVRLFLAAGELEAPEAFLHPLDRLVERLRNRGYRNLELAHTVIAGERHSGVKAEAFSRGLRWVFTRPALDLPADALADYAGEYVHDGSHPLQPTVFWPGLGGQASWPGRDGPARLGLRVEGDRLIVAAESGLHDGDELVPVAPDVFAFTGSIPGEMKFTRGSRGTVDHLSMRLSDLTVTLDRVC
jgi:predicted alpha/beta superfamily hydrolase